jgi:asparagine N-glycosylation enzyme membrane subunit Stt3
MYSLHADVSKDRVAALNLNNAPDKSGIIRGSILAPGQKQKRINHMVALSTLVLFISWPYFIFFLLVLSALFSYISDCIREKNRSQLSFVQLVSLETWNFISFLEVLQASLH